MKIQFKENIRLAINDFNYGTEFKRRFKKNEVVDINGIIDNTHGFKDIHFAYKIVAECVCPSTFAVVS